MAAGFEAEEDKDEDAAADEALGEWAALDVDVEDDVVASDALTNIVPDPDPDPETVAAVLLTNPNDPPCLRFFAKGVLKSGRDRGCENFAIAILAASGSSSDPSISSCSRLTVSPSASLKMALANRSSSSSSSCCCLSAISSSVPTIRFNKMSASTRSL